jgi:thiol:disulfide interchange protein
MFRLGYFLSLLLVLTLACSTLSAPAESVREIVTEVPTSLPQSIESPTQEVSQTSELSNSALVDFYDPARNPADDLTQAIVVAQKENKRIMLELGGDWCIWCKYMDDFYKSHPDILQARAENYVLVKINVSEDNANEEFLSQFPEAAGYPHIYILESDGTFLHSQNTVDLEDGADSYVPEVFMTFLQKWAPVK